MPLNIINEDITKVTCDAIVNPTDSYYSGSGGTDYAIHVAAGPKLDMACSKLPPLNTGEAVSTPGFDLPCEYVIHTTGPRWTGGDNNEAVLLRSCYINSLIKAKSIGVESIAFPLISSGTFGFPKDRVLKIATDAISDYLYTSDEDIDVSICIRDSKVYELSRETDLEKYIKDKVTLSESYTLGSVCENAPKAAAKANEDFLGDIETCCNALPYEFDDMVCCSSVAESSLPKEESLNQWIKKQDDTFAVMLFKLIDKKGMTDVECYKKANVTKGTFYKIRNLDGYKPSKPTVLAFAIALELSLKETESLLKTVGLSLSHSNVADMIVEYYITHGIYDIFEINAALYKYDQVPLGY